MMTVAWPCPSPMSQFVKPFFISDERFLNYEKEYENELAMMVRQIHAVT